MRIGPQSTAPVQPVPEWTGWSGPRLRRVSDTESPILPGLRRGAIVLAVGGLVWWLVGSSPTPGAFIWLGILGLLVTVPLAWYARRLPDDGEAEAFASHRRPYTILNIAQLAAIIGVVVVCGLAGAPWLIPGLVAVVNGLHFVPLGRWFGVPGYARLGIAVVVIGVLGVLWGTATRSAPNVQALVGLLVAIGYWLVPTVRLLQQRRQDRGPSTMFQFIDDPDDDNNENEKESR